MAGGGLLDGLGVVVVYASLVPTGILLLRFVERFRESRFDLTDIERFLLAPYLTVGLLYVIASVPVPLVSRALVLAVVGGGALGALFLWVTERGRSLRDGYRWARTSTGFLVMILTAGLVLIELYSVAGIQFPNAYDGSFQSIYVQLTVTNGFSPIVLEPYASFGVTYPAGASVWFAVPVLMLGLSIPRSIVLLPSMFLGLAPAAAFCWGSRLGGPNSRQGQRMGLTFAAFFALVASWPRLFIGGSFDFAFCLPLFFLTLGWIRPFVQGRARDWRDVIVFGSLLGVSTAISLALGESIVLLLVVWVGVEVWRTPGLAAAWLARIAAILGVALPFVARSIAGTVVWFSYPAHVLTATGTPPLAPIPGLPQATLAEFAQYVNPFVPWKWMLSPIPALSVEVAVLLAAGVALTGIWWSAPRYPLRRVLDRRLMVEVSVPTATFLLWTSFLIGASGVGGLSSITDSLTSRYESSFVLFIFYQAVAILPILALVEYVRLAREETPLPTPATDLPPRLDRRTPYRGSRRAWGPATAVALVAVAMTVGGVATVTAVPPFLTGHLTEFSQMTASDELALEWAAAHLPSCSVVLVAPGSAGQFLPLYATVHVDYPMMPLPVNYSYYQAIDNLSEGVYSPSVRQSLLYLGITEVFVSGTTSVSYPAIAPTPLTSSPDFSTLFHHGDAYVFEFSPGVASSGCAPA